MPFYRARLEYSLHENCFYTVWTRTSHWGQHLIAAVGQTDSSAAVIRKRLAFECVLRLFSGSTKSEPICLPKLRNYTTQFRP